MYVWFFKSNILKLVTNVHKHNMPPSPVVVYLQLPAIIRLLLLLLNCWHSFFLFTVVRCQNVIYTVVNAVLTIRSVCTQKFMLHINVDAKIFKLVSDRMPSVMKSFPQWFSSNILFGGVMPEMCHYILRVF